MIDALATEWVKLRTTRSSAVFLLVLTLTIGLCLGYTVYVVHLWESVHGAKQASVRATPPELLARMILPLAAGVFGALAATSEYATGTIRTTLIALPRRFRLLFAKAILVAVWSIVGSAGCFLVSCLAARPIVHDRPIRYLTTPVTEMLPHLLVQSVAAGVIALVGLGIGFLLRGTAASVTTMVVLVFLGQMVVGNLPSPWNERISSVLLVELGSQVVADPSGVPSITNGMLSAPEAVAVLAAYTALALGLAAIRLRRDT